MRHKPKTPLDQFNTVREIMASEGYKIFTPVSRYFRTKPHFIAVRNDFRGQSFYYVRLRRKKHIGLRWLPPRYEDRRIAHILETNLGIKIHIGRPLPHVSWEEAKQLVAYKERLEYNRLINHAQLS